MASKGGRDDSTRSKKEKPSYDGKVSSWPAFRIKGENYIHLKGWAPMVLGTAPTMTKWYVTKVSTSTSSKGTYTSKAILDAVASGKVDPADYVVQAEK